MDAHRKQHFYTGTTRVSGGTLVLKHVGTTSGITVASRGNTPRRTAALPMAAL